MPIRQWTRRSSFAVLRILLAGVALAAAAPAADPLFAFDNGTGRGVLTIDEQVDLAHRTGYAGVFMSGTKDMPVWLESHRRRGMKFLGIYTGTDISKENPTFDPGLPEAIRQLKGTGTLITFTVNGKAADGDARAVPIVRQVAEMAAEAGLEVALYPHYGFHVARIEDALRVREKVGKANVGIVFNLCHWLRSGDRANLAVRLKEAILYTKMVSINGADPTGDWDRLIQPLGQGSYDVAAFVRAVRAAGYKGPIGLQCYNVKGDREDNLRKSMTAWKAFR